MTKKIILIFLAALILRLISLDQSLWLDEAVTAKVVSHYGYGQIITQFSPTDFHPPFYYLFMKFWTGFFGYSEIALRMPSVIFSLATGWVLYLMAGIWPAIFFLFNPLVVYYSQEARMYMMAVFFLTLSIYLVNNFFSEVNSSPNARQTTDSSKKIFTAILLGLSLISSFYTFYGSIFFIVTLFVYLFYKKQYPVFCISGLVFLVLSLPLLPLLHRQFVNSKIMLQTVTQWSMVLGKANLKNLFLIPLKFCFGRISFYPKYIYYLLSGLWTAIVFYFAVKGGFKKKGYFFLFLFPLLLGLIFSFASPLLQYFRFLYLLPVLAIIISYGLPDRSHTNRSGLWVAVGFTVLSCVYLFIPQFHREDWKALSRSFARQAKVFMIRSSSDPIGYYRPDVKIIDLRQIGRYLGTEKDLTVIPYTADIYGFDYRKKLDNENYLLREKKVFREVYWERFSRQ
jgi:uncharacterized membrane protein